VHLKLSTSLFIGVLKEADCSLDMQCQDLDPEIVKALAETMLSFALPCKIADTSNLVDIVGTGGDGLDSFNVSTAAGIVLAACGLRCSKHGNRSATGSVGSADFLEALGCKIHLNGEQVAAAIGEAGFGFLFAQQFHPAMKHVAAVRKELGFKTALNLLGPLTNPARPELQVPPCGAAAPRR
jgi:anthranilate phosphoribosyltransferase